MQFVPMLIVPPVYELRSKKSEMSGPSLTERMGPPTAGAEEQQTGVLAQVASRFVIGVQPVSVSPNKLLAERS